MCSTAARRKKYVASRTQRPNFKTNRFPVDEGDRVKTHQRSLLNSKDDSAVFGDTSDESRPLSPGSLFVKGRPTTISHVPTSSIRTLETTSATSTSQAILSHRSEVSSKVRGGVVASIVLAGAGFILISIAVVALYSIRRRRWATSARTSRNDKLTGNETTELPQGRHYERAELAATPNQVAELNGDQQYRSAPPIESSAVVAPQEQNLPTIGPCSKSRNGSRINGPLELAWP